MMPSSKFRFQVCIVSLTIVFLCVPDVAVAQSSGGDFVNGIAGLVNEMFARTNVLGIEINERVAPLAGKMLLYLTAILIVYNASIFLLKDGSVNEFFVQTFVLIITYNLAKFLGSQEVSLAIRNFFDTVAGLVNPQLDTTSPAGFLVSEFQNIFAPVAVLLESDLWTNANFLTESTIVLALVASLFLMSLAGIFSGIVLVLNFLTSEIMFLFAIGLAPIFAYSLAIPFLSFLFDAWIRFLLAACGFKIILAGVSALSSVASEKIRDFSNMQNVDADFSTLAPSLSITIIFTVLAGAVYVLVPMITNQLFGSGSRLGVGAGLSQMGRAVNGVPKLPTPRLPPQPPGGGGPPQRPSPPQIPRRAGTPVNK
jgi:hypothetical protein